MVDFEVGNEQNTRTMHPSRAFRVAGAPKVLHPPKYEKNERSALFCID